MAENQPNIKEIIKQEYIKCSQDPSYFMKKYCYVQHPMRGRILFHLYPFQEKVLKLCQENNYVIINKSRQLGISTLSAGYSLWLMLFQKDKNVLCIATKQETAKNMVTKVKFMYDNLPSWLKVTTLENNKLTLKFTNGSQIKAVSAASDSGRSEAVSLLLIDEAAFIEGIGEIWASVQQTLATGGGCIAISTPYGTGNWFHKTFTSAENNENDFLPIKLPWFVHPERDQSWRDKQDELLGDPRLAAQECFSGDVIIYTKHGPKFIKDIKINDEVLSHDGTYNKVTKIFTQNKDNNLYKIKSGLNNIEKYVTSNHPFYNEDNEWVEIKNIISDITKIQTFPANINEYNNENIIDLLDYIEAENPKYFPIKSNENYIWLNKKSYINRYIKFDYRLGFIIGCFLSEGSYWKNVVAFSYNQETESNCWPSILEKYINEIFNIEIFTRYLSKKDKGGNLYIKNQIFKKFIELCITGGKKCYEKQLSSFIYTNGNKELFKGILDGILIGDGMLNNKYNINIGLSSQKLIYDVLYISNLLNYNFITIKKRDKKENVIFPNNKIYDTREHFILTFCNTKEEHNSRLFSERVQNINLNKNSRKSTKFTFNNNPLTTINVKPIKNENIQVYNFEVENTHTYVTEYGIVHNCDADFSTSGDVVFYPEWIEMIKNTTIKEPLEKRGVDKNLWIWESVDYSREYMVTADVARGDGKDYSACHIIDIQTNTQVAEYKGQLPPKEFGLFLTGLATEYNNALLVVEANNVGWACLDAIIERGYKNLYYSPKSDIRDHESYFSRVENSNNLAPGFSTNLRTRPLIIAKLRETIGDRSVTIQSNRLLEEMKIFIWKNGRAEAQTGYNDDLVMSFAIGQYLRETSIKFQQQSLDMARAALGNLNVNRSSQPGVYNSNTTINPYSARINGKDEDISWLF
jgi:hypothetical protein